MYLLINSKLTKVSHSSCHMYLEKYPYKTTIFGSRSNQSQVFLNMFFFKVSKKFQENILVGPFHKCILGSFCEFEPINIWWYSHDTKIKADQILIIETYYKLNVYYHLSSRRGKSGTWKQFVFVIAVNTFYTMLKITSKLTFLHFSSRRNCLPENWNCPRIDQYLSKSLIENIRDELS